MSVAFPSFFAVFGPSLDFLHMPASTCSSLSFLCAVIFLNLLVLFGGAVRSWEVWEVFFLFVFFIFLCCLVVWCGAVVGGGVGGGGGGADDVHANATCFFFLFSSSSCAVWWCGAVVGGGVGGVGGVGGGLMTSMRMRLVFSFCFLHLLVLFGGAVRSWGGGGGGGGGGGPRVFAAFKTTT